MRHLIAAALLVSPLMVNAQTAPSAQNMAAMQSNIAASKMMSSAAASAADRTQPAPTKIRISSGVVAPKLIHTVAIHQASVSVSSFGRNMRSAAVSMVVDDQGNPTNVKILRSAGPDMDPNILEAVSQYRFLPATVSGQKTAMELNLYMEIQVTQ